MAQEDDFLEVKRRRRNISNDASQTPKKSTKSIPISTAGKLSPRTMLTRNFFAPLRTNDMDTETTGAEKALPEHKASRKSAGRHQ
jgi:hypothetical protein